MKKSKGMQLGAMLAVMLLLGMAFVPAVSAKKIDESDLIPIDKVNLYASYELNYFAVNTPGFEGWINATIGEPVLITDFNNDPVLYDVPVIKNGKNKGIIKIWAKKSMGVPFYSVSTQVIEPSEKAKNAVEKNIK